ncbi:diphthine--ammonia ligase [Rhodotorula paludigena]|uniref:diphthine--ammonia ligase n=1 Tax=Rhodotorula paludigena TaxID=86838 RepID=UPI0031761AF5
MKCVGLLSGGKDSVYTLHHCLARGHLPVALASLVPPHGQDELDSFMYQTVGSSGLQTLASVLDLPLYTHTIAGTAINQRAEYGSRKGKAREQTHPAHDDDDTDRDETEDLFQLLQKVKAAHPDVEGVSVGAILSNYQRVRVEHVCARLGLTPLAWLWEREQKELLAEMVDAGMECVLVKVAGAGLGVQHLGKTLAEMQPTLHRLNEQYETHVCGEGGEYETFTVDSPLFLRRVQLDEVREVVTNADRHATVAHLYLSRLSLGPLKPAYAGAERGEARWARAGELCREVVERPGLWASEVREGAWRECGREAWERVAAEGLAEEEEQERASVEKGDEEALRLKASARETGDGWLYLAEVGAPSELCMGEIEDEVRACFAALEDLLSAHGASLLSLAHLTVYLSPSAHTMALFPRINAIYAAYFGTSPPTRACVAVPGPGPGDEGAWRVKLEGVARVGTAGEGRGDDEERKALHVQSLSYWAAANIGPYSQAVKTAGRVFVAGQIPLLPSTLTLPPPSSSSTTSPADEAAFDFASHASLSLQHAHRILSSSHFSPLAPSTPLALGRAEGAIVWLAPCASRAEWAQKVECCRAVWRASGAEGTAPPPLVAVEAAALPKGAEVEWQITWCVPPTQGALQEDDEDSEGEESTAAGHGKDVDSWCRMETVSNDTGRPVSYQCSQRSPAPDSAGQDTVFAILGCSLGEERPHALPGIDRSNLHSIRAFYRPSRCTPTQVRNLASTLLSLPPASATPTKPASAPAISYIPSHRLSMLSGVEAHDVVFVIVAGAEKL